MAEPLAVQNSRASQIFSSKQALLDDYMRLELPMIEVRGMSVRKRVRQSECESKPCVCVCVKCYSFRHSRRFVTSFSDT